MDILNAFHRLPVISYFGIRRDDDFADRLNYKYTVGLLVFFSIVIASKQFSNDHIQCWVPAIFTRNYEIYVSNYCWIHNTYHINISEPNIKKAYQKRYVLRYYQFVPFILLIQSLFYILPRLFWRSLSRHSGIDVKNLIDAAQSLKSVKRFHKQKVVMQYLISLINQYVDDPRKKQKSRHSKWNTYFYGLLCCLFGMNYFNAYLLSLYLFIKLLYIINSLFQLVAIYILLESSFHRKSFDIQNIFYGILKQNPMSKYFPKISMCDFRIIEPNSDEGHKYTVQCVLTINVYNEQIFTVLYIWILLVLFITMYDFLSWIIFLIFPKLRYSFFIQRINVTQSLSTIRTTMHLFVYDYMQHDGFFILRLIHSNAGEQVCSDILTSLWKNFYRTDKENGTSITNVSKNKMTTHTSINRAEIDATTHSSRNGTNQTNNPQQRLGGFFNYSRTITNL